MLEDDGYSLKAQIVHMYHLQLLSEFRLGLGAPLRVLKGAAVM